MRYSQRAPPNTKATISAAVQQSTRYKLVQITASKTLHHPIGKQQYNPQSISLTEQAPDTKATLAKCIFTKGCIFVTPPNSQRQLVQQNPPKDLRKAHLRLRNFVLQKKTHPKILPSTPAICLYTLWTFTMMFFRANLTQRTLYTARTINLKRPTNWGRHPIHSKFPICSGLHDFRSISITISNVFLIFLSSWYFLSCIIDSKYYGGWILLQKVTKLWDTSCWV